MTSAFCTLPLSLVTLKGGANASWGLSFSTTCPAHQLAWLRQISTVSQKHSVVRKAGMRLSCRIPAASCARRVLRDKHFCPGVFRWVCFATLSVCAVSEPAHEDFALRDMQSRLCCNFACLQNSRYICLCQQHYQYPLESSSVTAICHALTVYEMLKSCQRRLPGCMHACVKTSPPF